jgi:hypothetical protein
VTLAHDRIGGGRVAYRPLASAVLFFSLTGVNTAASISAREFSNGITRAIISSGSPFAVIAASRRSASKTPNLRHRPHTRESCCHNSDSHNFAQIALFFEVPSRMRRSPSTASATPSPHVSIKSLEAECAAYLANSGYGPLKRKPL